MSLGEGYSKATGCHLWLGDQVLLSGLAGRPIRFGVRQEVELLDIPASAVLAVLPEALRDAEVSADSDPMQHWDRDRLETVPPGFEEGDPRGLR